MAARPAPIPRDQTGASPTHYGGRAGFDEDGRTAAVEERDRYRGLGDPDQGRFQARPGVQLQFGKAEADEANSLRARGNQIEALGLIRNAAQGGAPSEAAILGGQVAGQSAQEAMRAQAGARTPVQQGAAQAGALRNMAATQQGGVGGFGGMRSAETGQDLDLFTGGAGAIRKQDYGNQDLAQKRAEAIASNELSDRDYRQRRQIGYERLAFGTQSDEMNNELRREDLYRQMNQDAVARALQARQDRSADASAVLGAITPSDPKTKNVLPPSALAKLASEAKGRINEAQQHLKTGPSVGQPYHPDEENLPDQEDVNAVKYGPGKYDSPFKRSDEPDVQRDTDALHKGIEAQIEKDKEPGAPVKGYAHPEGSYSLKGLGLSEGEASSPYDRGESKRAPGSEDWLRYGAPGKTRKGDYGFDPMGRLMYGPDTAGSDMGRMDEYSKAITMSDPAAKREAFIDGMNYGGGESKRLPDYMPASKGHEGGYKPPPEAPAPGPEKTGTNRADRASRWAQIGTSALTGNPVLAGAALARSAEGTAADLNAPKRRDPTSFTRENVGPGPLPQTHPDDREAAMRQVPIQMPKNTPDEDHPWSQPSDEKAKSVIRNTLPSAERKALLGGETGKRAAESPPLKEHPYYGPGEDDDPVDESDDEILSDAALRLKAKPYTYKDEYNPGEQERGELNYGPMADEMEKNPITATAVKKDPKTGMRMVDMMKLVKVQSGLIADLRQDVNGLTYGGRRER